MRTLNKIINIFSVIAMFLLVGLIVLILVELISRNLLNLSIPWAIEVSEYLLAYIVFLGTPWVLKEDGHVKFSLVIDRLSLKNKIIASIISNIIGFIATIIVSFFASLQIISLYNRNVRTETFLELPLAVLISVVPISFFLIAAQFIIKFSKDLGQFRNMEKGDA